MDVMIALVLVTVVAVVLVGVCLWMWKSLRSFEREAQIQQYWRDAESARLREKFGLSNTSKMESNENG